MDWFLCDSPRHERVNHEIHMEFIVTFWNILRRTPPYYNEFCLTVAKKKK